MSAAPPPALVAEIVARALAEDLGGRGDITTQATIDAAAKAGFVIAAREGGVLAGTAAAHETFRQVDPAVRLAWRLDDGGCFAAGDVLARIDGPARAILTGERTALNFLGRLCGIATLTRRYVDAVAGTGVGIAHTRKTTPGLRALELAAVRAGGGAAHRYSLADAVLIKDNHVAVSGGVGPAVRRAKVHAGHMTRVAVEIDRLDQLGDALDAGADSVLLDNFALVDLAEAVRRTAGRATLEASGGVTLATLRTIAETGIDVISAGALTHSAASLDVGLDVA